MCKIKTLPPFNKYNKQIQTISEFKKLFQQYHSSSSKEELKISLREKLNLLSSEISYYVEKAGMSSYAYNPSNKYPIEFFSNLFILQQYHVTPQQVCDVLDQTIGKYKLLQKLFHKKLINPIYWIGEIIRVPFHIASFAGFDIKKIEFSWIGKTYKLIASFFVLLAAIVTILTYFGYGWNDILNRN